MTKSWGRNEQAVTASAVTTVESSNGAPIGTYVWVKKGKTGSAPTNAANAHFGNTSAGSRANVDSNMFANVTMGAFVNNMAVGVFAVSAKQIAIVDGQILDGQVNKPGSGYFANATITFSGAGYNSGVANAQANSLGRIANINISTNGATNKQPIAITISAPSAQSFNSNTALFSAQTINSNTSLFSKVIFNLVTNGNSNGAILAGTVTFQNNDPVQFSTAPSNVAPTTLTNAATYYVTQTNTSAFYLTATPGGVVITTTNAIAGSTEEYLTRKNFVYTSGTNPFANGTVVQYAVATGNTAISPLASGNNYYMIAANSSGFALSNTLSGAVVNLVPGVTETGHTLTRYNFIALPQSPSVYQNGDKVKYAVAAGNTAIAQLSNGATYHITGANSTGFFLAANSTQYKNGQYLTLTPGVTETGHTVQGETATGNVTIGGAKVDGVAHAGWHIRREGTGGRAGRVHYECLVAMHSLGAQTAQYGTPALVANAAGVANAVVPSAN